MSKEQDFYIHYEDINGEEKNIIIEASSHVEAAEILETEDPDSGQVFAVRNAKEQQAFERACAKRHSYENLSI